MVKKLMLAVGLVALLAAPAFAAVQNVKVGGDLKTTSVIRKNFIADGTGYSAAGGDVSQNIILSQVGLNVSADLTDNVSTTLRLVNERVWGDYDSSSNADDSAAGMDLDTAYVTMKEFLYAPLTVTLGRQPLSYGNQLIIGDGDSSTDVNVARDITGGVNFDAVKAVLNFDPLVVDVFASKTSELGNGGDRGQNDDDDTNLYGINGNFKLGGDMNVELEGYLFAQHDKSALTAANSKTQKLYVPGLRASLNPMEGLGIQLEGAYQTGNTTADNTISAYALQGMFSLALPVAKDMKMGLSGGYTILSGNKTVAPDTKQNAWTSIAENQWTGRIFDTIYSSSNARIAELALEMVPLQDVTTKLSVYNIIKDKKDATGPGVIGSNDQKGVGNEVDLDVTYAYTEDVKFGVSAGLFMPGKAFDTVDDNATQILSSVSVLF